MSYEVKGYSRGSMVPNNRYKFHCPTVGRDELFLACMFRRHKVWRGEDIKEGECKMCMRAGKCPIVHMLNKEMRVEDPLYVDLKGEKVHKLDADVQAQIARVLVLPFHAAGIDVSVEWMEKLTGEAKRYMPHMFGEQATAAAVAEPAKKPRARKEKAPDKTASEGVMDLGKVGIDMAQALNAA